MFRMKPDGKSAVSERRRRFVHSSVRTPKRMSRMS